MRGFFSLMVAIIVAACAGSKDAETSKVPLSEAPAAPSINEPGALAGPVVEKLDAPPYSYLKVKTAQGEVWAAVPQTNIAKGTTVRVFNPMLMTDFSSKALKRTFKEVYFGTLTADASDAAVNGAGPATDAPKGAPGAMPPGDNPHAGMNMAANEPVKVGTVAKASGADAYTIEEAFAKKDELAGKTISVRGTVVKYNAQVMGKNWVHLQDGSGAAATLTNDITVTTLDETTKGQTITVRGTVKTSKDFGAGYKYAVIIEDAKIVKP